LIRAQVDISKALAKKAVKTALDLETTPYYTQNTHYLQTLREKWLACYKAARNQPHKYKVYNGPVEEAMPEDRAYGNVARAYEREPPESKALRALAEAGYTGLTIPDLSRLLPPDSREKELIVMADVRAYYHVAYKVSLAYRLGFNVFIASSSASLTIFL
jgi:hypothetical protein